MAFGYSILDDNICNEELKYIVADSIPMDSRIKRFKDAVLNLTTINSKLNKLKDSDGAIDLEYFEVVYPVTIYALYRVYLLNPSKLKNWVGALIMDDTESVLTTSLSKLFSSIKIEKKLNYVLNSAFSLISLYYTNFNTDDSTLTARHQSRYNISLLYNCITRILYTSIDESDPYLLRLVLSASSTSKVVLKVVACKDGKSCDVLAMKDNVAPYRTKVSRKEVKFILLGNNINNLSVDGVKLTQSNRLSFTGV